ncbi:MAG: hypothetical protein ACOC0H_02810 [Thermodesulfobacteriota bacterium]
MRFKIRLIACGGTACVAAFKHKDIDPLELFLHFKEAALYDLNPSRMTGNFYRFAERLVEEGLLSKHVRNKLESEK